LENLHGIIEQTTEPVNRYVDAPTNLDKAEEEICVSVFRSVMRSHNMLHAIGCKIAAHFDLQLAEMNVIDMLGKHGALTMGELSRTTFIAPSSTTRTVKQLESRDLVKRQRSRDSGRVVHVSLTRRGKSLFKKSYPAILESVQQELGSNLNFDDRLKLADLLQRLVDREK